MGLHFPLSNEPKNTDAVLKSKITLIGSGNLASHLARAFDLAGHQIHQIVSRNEVSGKALAKMYAAFYSNNPSNTLEDSDFVFLTVPDKAIELTLKSIKPKGPIFLHCAGSVSLAQIESYKDNVGVFYPLQTFTVERPVNFFNIPVFIEASNQDTFQKIWDLADSISNTVKHLDSDKRFSLHLAAVVANNFTNYLLVQTEKILATHNLPMEYIKPLVEETVKKAFDIGPIASQTGPAIRHDTVTIQKHLDSLASNPEMKEMYAMLSNAIQMLAKR